MGFGAYDAVQSARMVCIISTSVNLPHRFFDRDYLLQGEGSGFLRDGGSYVTLTDGTDFTIVVEKMSWAHSQWFDAAFYILLLS